MVLGAIMRDGEKANKAAVLLQEFADEAVEIPAQLRKRAQHLPQNRLQTSRAWWFIVGGVVVIAVVVGWLLGRA